MESYLLYGIVNTLITVYIFIKWSIPNNIFNNKALNDFIFKHPGYFIILLGMITIFWPIAIIIWLLILIDGYSDDI